MKTLFITAIMALMLTASANAQVKLSTEIPKADAVKIIHICPHDPMFKREYKSLISRIRWAHIVELTALGILANGFNETFLED